MPISDWSSDVCSSDLDGQGTDIAGTSLVVADLAHSEKLNKEVRHGTGRQCHRNPLPDTQHRGDNGPLGLSINSGPEAMQRRSEEHTSELQSLMRISYAVLCLKKNNN